MAKRQIFTGRVEGQFVVDAVVVMESAGCDPKCAVLAKLVRLRGVGQGTSCADVELELSRSTRSTIWVSCVVSLHTLKNATRSAVREISHR